MPPPGTLSARPGASLQHHEINSGFAASAHYPYVRVLGSVRTYCCEIQSHPARQSDCPSQALAARQSRKTVASDTPIRLEISLTSSPPKNRLSTIWAWR